MANDKGRAAPVADRFDEEINVRVLPYFRAYDKARIDVRVMGSRRNERLDAAELEFENVGEGAIECFVGGGERVRSVPVEKGETFRCPEYSCLAAVRDYEGLEIRLTFTAEKDENGETAMFSVTIGTTSETRRRMRLRETAKNSSKRKLGDESEAS